MSLTISNNNTNVDNNCTPNYYLLCSTSTFIFPIIYAYKKKNVSLAMYTTIALFGSLNYWRKPCIGYRRNIDMITSKISCMAYSYYGLSYISGFWPFIIGCSNLYGMYYFYNKSCINFELSKPKWVYFHIGFHLIATISKMYIIYWV
jgi:hypothetical protein